MKQHKESHGYWATYQPSHYRARHNGDVLVHILIAEEALGKPLPPKAEVHHWGEIDDNSKLVLCEDHAYHYLLHQRTEALETTGDVHQRKCVICGRYCDPEDPVTKMTVRTRKDRKNGNGQAYHRECAAVYQSNRR